MAYKADRDTLDGEYRHRGDTRIRMIRVVTTMTIPEAQANLPEIVENLKPGEHEADVSRVMSIVLLVRWPIRSS